MAPAHGHGARRKSPERQLKIQNQSRTLTGELTWARQDNPVGSRLAVLGRRVPTGRDGLHPNPPQAQQYFEAHRVPMALPVPSTRQWMQILNDDAEHLAFTCH